MSDKNIDLSSRTIHNWFELRDAQGRFAHDPLMDYERGRRRIPHVSIATNEATA